MGTRSFHHKQILLSGLLGADGLAGEGELGGALLAGSADLLGALEDGGHLAGTAEGDLGEVSTDNTDGLGDLGGLDASGEDLGGGLAVLLGGDGDLLLALGLDDGGVGGEEASVALGPLARVVEGVVGEADAVALLEVLGRLADNQPLEVVGVGHRGRLECEYRNTYV